MSEADIIRATAQGVLIAWVFVLCAKTTLRCFWLGDASVRPGVAMVCLYVALGAGTFIGGDDLIDFLWGLIPGL